MISYRELKCGCEYSEFVRGSSSDFSRVVVAPVCALEHHRELMHGATAKRKKKKRGRT